MSSEESSFSRIQGLETTRWVQPPDKEEPIQGIDAIRKLWFQLPVQSRKKTLHPLLSYLTERGVAVAIGAEMIEDPKRPWDLELPDGTRVEVKTIILDPDRRRSPVLQLRPKSDFQFLAIVVFLPDLTVETAKMIPVEALSLYGRHDPTTSRGMVNVRVTMHLLHYPGSSTIPLDQNFLR